MGNWRLHKFNWISMLICLPTSWCKISCFHIQSTDWFYHVQKINRHPRICCASISIQHTVWRKRYLLAEPCQVYIYFDELWRLCQFQFRNHLLQFVPFVNCRRLSCGRLFILFSIGVRWFRSITQFGWMENNRTDVRDIRDICTNRWSKQWHHCASAMETNIIGCDR